MDVSTSWVGLSGGPWGWGNLAKCPTKFLTSKGLDLCQGGEPVGNVAETEQTRNVRKWRRGRPLGQNMKEARLASWKPSMPFPLAFGLEAV